MIKFCGDVRVYEEFKKEKKLLSGTIIIFPDLEAFYFLTKYEEINLSPGASVSLGNKIQYNRSSENMKLSSYFLSEVARKLWEAMDIQYDKAVAETENNYLTDFKTQVMGTIPEEENDESE